MAINYNQKQVSWTLLAAPCPSLIPFPAISSYPHSNPKQVLSLPS